LRGRRRGAVARCWWGVCGELFGSERVVLAGEGESFDLGESAAGRAAAGKPAKRAKRSRRAGGGRVRQRTGKHGQPGVHDRLRAQGTFRPGVQVACSE
jgi:hypothetical protein